MGDRKDRLLASLAALAAISLMGAGGGVLELPQGLQAAVGPSYSAVITADNPLIYWRLNETSGSTANNSGTLGAAGNGTYGPSTLLNQPGGVLNSGGDPSAGFNTGATNTYVQRTGLTGWPTGNFSVEFWMNSPSAHGGSGVVSYASPSGDNAFLLFDPNNLNLYVNNAASPAVTGVDASDGTWHHIVVTYDQALGQTRLYNNGVLANTNNFVAGAGIPSNGSLVLGQEQDSVGPAGGGFDSAQAYSGRLDEFALYGYTLSQSQITAHFEQGTILYIPPITLTPEPMSWALMALSLAGLGYFQYRRSRRFAMR